ncbi:MAG: hypothetical protein WAO12_10105 [Venatoribacter sp.]
MLIGSLSVLGLLVCAALGFAVFLLLWPKNWLIPWLKGTAGLLLAFFAVALLFSLFDFWSYSRSAKEESLGTVSISKQAHQNFVLTLTDSSGKSKSYPLLGDQWQLDVRMLTWKGPFHADPLYRLDRLSGRYLALEQERRSPRTLYPLEQSGIIDLWQWFNSVGFLFDAQYGNAVYMPLAEGAVFYIYMTPNGLISRAANEIAAQSLGKRW